MRFILFFCLFLLLAQVSAAQNTKFYDKVLSDVERIGSKRLIALDVDSKVYKGRAVIENGDLFLFLQKTKNLDEKAYKPFVKELLISKKPLSVGDAKIEEERFIAVKEFKEVSEYAAKGKEKFVAHYFNGNFMKDEFVAKDKNRDVMFAVADKLFQWQVATLVDDFSGVLYIWDYPYLK